MKDKRLYTNLRVLIVEDTPADAELMVLRLETEGFKVNWTRIETEEAYKSALDTPFDLILSDWSLPQFNGLVALQLMQERRIDTPFILVSGGIGEETAVAVMRQGAADYLLKDRMDRLGQAVKNALEQKRLKDEYKKAVEALSASEAELRALFASMQDLVLVLDREGVYRRIAPTKPDLLILPADELLGKKLYDVFPPGQAQEFTHTIQKVLETRQTDTIEYGISLRGKLVWFETSISPLSDDEVIWVARDISERKQAQAQNQLQAAALEAAANGIVITDRDGVIEWVNPAFTALTGYTLSEAEGKNPRELVKSGQHERVFYKQIWDTILAGEVWQGELNNRRKDGSLYSEEQTITPLLDTAGRITHFIGIKQDISARKQAESALRQSAVRREVIAALGRALAAAIDLEVIYRTAKDYIQSTIDCPNFAFTLFDPQQEILKAAFVSSDGVLMDVNAIPPLQFDLQHASSGRSKAIASQSPEIVLDMEAKRKPGVGLVLGSEMEPQSAIYVPMLAEGQVIGLMELQSYQNGAYTAEDGEWLSMAANQIGMSIQNARLFTRAQQRIAELSALAIIDSAVTSRLAPQATFEILLEQVTTQLKTDAAVLFLFNPQSQELECVFERGYTRTRNLQIRLRLGESLAGQVAFNKRMLHFNLLSSENAHLLKEDSLLEGFEDYYGVPLLVEGEIIGVLEALHRSQLNPDSDWLRFLAMLAGQSAIVISTLRLYEDVHRGNVELLKAYDATIEGWSQAMDLRDSDTEGHTRRVTEMAIHLAKEMGIAEELLIHLRRGALLHDIGKLGVPDSILRKPDSLSEDEWVLMKKHPEYAYHMLESIEYLHPALDIPYCHHEKWDGAGYPRGLTGNEIPLAARLFAVIDVWDALTSDRPYRKSLTEEAALQHISDQAGKHFDPQVVEAFIRLYKKNLHTLGFLE